MKTADRRKKKTDTPPSLFELPTTNFHHAGFQNVEILNRFIPKNKNFRRTFHHKIFFADADAKEEAIQHPPPLAVAFSQVKVTIMYPKVVKDAAVVSNIVLLACLWIRAHLKHVGHQ